MNKIIYSVSHIVYWYTSSKLYIFSYIIYFIIIYLPYIRLYGHYSQMFSSVTVTTCFNDLLVVTRKNLPYATFVGERSNWLRLGYIDEPHLAYIWCKTCFYFYWSARYFDNTCLKKIRTFVHFITVVHVPVVSVSFLEHATVVIIKDIHLLIVNHTQSLT